MFARSSFLIKGSFLLNLSMVDQIRSAMNLSELTRADISCHFMKTRPLCRTTYSMNGLKKGLDFVISWHWMGLLRLWFYQCQSILACVHDTFRVMKFWTSIKSLNLSCTQGHFCFDQNHRKKSHLSNLSNLNPSLVFIIKVHTFWEGHKNKKKNRTSALSNVKWNFDISSNWPLMRVFASLKICVMQGTPDI